MADWRVSVLQSMGAPVTKKNLRFLTTWQAREGGHTNNTARYNWLNTTAGKGYPSMNSVGVRVFPDYKTGIKQTVATINNGRYKGIVRGLQAGDPYADPDIVGDLSTWVSGSRTARPDYASKVLGTKVKVAPAGKGGGRSTVAPRGVSPVQAEAPTAPNNDRVRQGQMALLDFVMDYANTGEVTRNSVAKLTGAVSRLGTVQPPPVVEKGRKATVSQRRDPVERGVADRVLAAAHTQVGKPYVFGSGPSTDSFDCSDLVQWAWGQVGVKIPRTTYEQMKVLPKVGWDSIQPGDLIYKNNGGHVVMYVGGGKVIAAPYTGTVVQYQPVSRFKSGDYHVRRVQ